MLEYISDSFAITWYFIVLTEFYATYCIFFFCCQGLADVHVISVQLWKNSIFIQVINKMRDMTQMR